MVTREEFKVIVKAMMAAYPQNCPVKTQDVFELWYSMLKDLTYGMVSTRLKKHIKTCKYAPSISELRGMSGEKINSFNNFHRRQYDMEQLERSLLESGQNRIEVRETYGRQLIRREPSGMQTVIRTGTPMV